jgi:hypothetical protein
MVNYFILFQIEHFFCCPSGLFPTRVLKPNEPLGIYRGKIRRTLPQTADEEYVWAVSLYSNFSSELYLSIDIGIKCTWCTCFLY